MKLAITADDVQQLGLVIGERLGLEVHGQPIDALTDLLQARIAATGAVDARAYFAKASNPNELRAFAAAWTVGETYFFRNEHHVRALSEHVIPACIRGRAANRTLRMLSAGCASGEEAYTLAMILLDDFPEIDTWNVQIVGIDVNASAIGKARRGLYTNWSLRATPDPTRKRWFRPARSSWVLSQNVRKRVTFEERNLIDEDPAFWTPHSFDLVMCRNVTMYMTPSARESVIARFGKVLRPGGYLFLGHAESLRSTRTAFELCQSNDTFYYRTRKHAAADVPAHAAHAVASAPARVAAWIEPPVRNDAPAALAVSHVHERVRDALRGERYAEALALLTASPADPSPTARLLRAVLLVNTGSIAEAERICAGMLEAGDADAGAHYLTALCREQAGDREGARRCDERATQLDAHFAMPHLHLGLMARRTGDTATARREIDAAASLLPAEDSDRVLLFGGGFTRDALLALCRAELRACGDRA